MGVASGMKRWTLCLRLIVNLDGWATGNIIQCSESYHGTGFSILDTERRSAEEDGNLKKGQLESAMKLRTLYCNFAAMGSRRRAEGRC